MKYFTNLRFGFCLLGSAWIVSCATAQPSPPPPRPATQSEVNAGTIANKFVSPLTLNAYSLGQATGGVSLVQVTNIAAYEVLSASNNLVLTNDTRSVSLSGRLALGATNVSSTATNFAFRWEIGGARLRASRLARPLAPP